MRLLLEREEKKKKKPQKINFAHKEIYKHIGLMKNKK